MRCRISERFALARSAILLVVAFCLAVPADARHSAIDFDDTSIALDGQSFSSDTTHCGAADTAPSSCRVNLFGDKSTGVIPLGFTIKIGTQTYTSLFINEAGIVTFGSALNPSGSFQPVANFAELDNNVTQPFIAPFYANLQTLDGTAPQDPFSVSNGGVMYQRGSADPTEPFSTAGLVPAVNVGWVEDVANSFFVPTIATQLLIYYTGSTSDADTTNDGDFAFRIRYSVNDGDEYNTGGPDNPSATAGFSLGGGTDTQAFTGRLRADDDIFFRFHNGHLTTSGSTSFTLNPTTGAEFGNQALFTTQNRNYTLTNTGTAPLPISGVVIMGTNQLQYAFTKTCGASLAVGAHCNITVKFRPTSAGAKAANLRVTVGNGTVATRALRGTGVSSTYSLNPTSLAFGSVPRNTTSAPKGITVKNTGTVILPITTISLGGTNPGQFTLAENCPANLAAGATCTITMRFKPTSTGAKSATVVVTPGGGASPKSVALSGTGS